ncbi:response regulator transcription factor [Kitasatospora sp. NPDC006697]|uniref:helix-turn-helix transcriptional regulator n=1 Tax=Kitasatospora sp. NPDC006697 TaxID=3364020 RepID=UPI0036D0AE2B
MKSPGGREIHGIPVVVALRNELLRYGIEYMLQTLEATRVKAVPGLRWAQATLEHGELERPILITMVEEVDDEASADILRRLERGGARILFLLSGGDLEALSRLAGRYGIAGAGFLAVGSLDIATLRETVLRMESGDVPMPPDLARRLLALAARGGGAQRLAPRITPREREALVLMIEGMSNKQIARRLHISEHGAKRLVANILAKLDCTNRTLAVAKALQHGLHQQSA